MENIDLNELAKLVQDWFVELNEQARAAIETLEAILEEFDEIEEEEFKLERGDEYWVVKSDGQVGDHIWTDHLYDDIALENNAIFRTREEAEFEAERLKVLRGLEKLGRPFKPHEDNYVIAFSHNAGLKVVGYVTTVTSYGNYYFDSEEEAREAIEKIGEDRIKKYLFGIELRGEPNE